MKSRDVRGITNISALCTYFSTKIFAEKYYVIWGITDKISEELFARRDYYANWYL